MKLAIFSGSIPSSAFVEHLIHGMSEHHEILLFGVVNKPTIYSNKNIKVYKTPHSHLLNLAYTIYRSTRLLLKKPKHFSIILKQSKTYPTLYEKWIWFSKFIPIATYEPDIIHLQWARDLDFYYFFKEQLNYTMVVSLRGAHINYTPIIEARIAEIYHKSFPNIDGFHAVSNAIALEAEQYGLDMEKTRVIHSWVNTSIVENYKTFKKKKGQPFKIISIGRFHWIKGLKYAIDACKLLKDENFDFHFHFVAGNEIDQESSFQIEQLSLNSEITIHSAKDQDALFDMIRSSDVLLLTSLAEGIANVVLEAMALGIPVISTDCDGMKEVIIHKETGWLVPKRNSVAIAQTLRDVANETEEEIQRITLNAHQLIKKEFDEGTSIQQFKDLYQGLMRE